MERAETQGEASGEISTEWQWRAPLLAALGALVGLATWLLIRGDETAIAAWRLSGVAFLLVASGLVLGLQVKPLRRITVASSVAGAVAFFGFVALG